MVRPIFPSERDDGEREREREREKKSKKRNENRRVETTSSSAGDRWPWLLGSSRTRATSSDLGMTPISHSSIAGTLRNPSRLPLLVPPLSLSLSLFFLSLSLRLSNFLTVLLPPTKARNYCPSYCAGAAIRGEVCVSVCVCIVMPLHSFAPPLPPPHSILELHSFSCKEMTGRAHFC